MVCTVAFKLWRRLPKSALLFPDVKPVKGWHGPQATADLDVYRANRTLDEKLSKDVASVDTNDRRRSKDRVYVGWPT